jgi:glutathione reductase (NADPH)
MVMTGYQFDLITIGAGSGGVAASRRAGSYGAKVALCEFDRVGGTCVLRGCVPKKLLVYASHVAEELRDAAGFGWTIGAAHHDWPALIAAKDRELDRLNQAYLRMLREAGVALHYGRAELRDAHTVLVYGPDGATQLTAANILIATGSYPIRPPIPGNEHAVSSNEILNLPALPRRVVIIGTGYIGVEFACMFHSLGVEVTLMGRGQTLLRGFDEEVRAHLTQTLADKGMRLVLGCAPTAISKQRDASYVVHSDSGEFAADLVLAATGRVPSTSSLGLAEVGVRLTPTGAVVVDEQSRTSVPGIYAVGDCTDRKNLTPVAIAEGRAVAEGLFNRQSLRVDYSQVPTAVFSQPPVSTVGLTESEARELYAAVDVYATRFRPMKYTLAQREERTFIKLIVDRQSQRVLGCHMVGPDAPEIIQGMAVALRCGATKQQLDATIGIHPTAAEELVTLRERRPDPAP